MDRRDVLKFGAVAGLGSSGCASLLSNPAAIGAGEMEGFLSALDTALATAARGNLFERFLPPSSEPSARTKRAQELASKTLRSLLLAGALHELPPEQVAHEGLQQRLRASMGEFDDAMFGMSSMLENLTATERADVSKALVEDPGLGMRIMGAIDEDAAALGISLKQRTKLRGLSTLACSRLRQSPGLVIEEYTGKLRKVAARHGATSEAERAIGVKLSSAMIWQGQAPVGGPGPTSETWTAPPLLLDPTCETSSDCTQGQVCAGYRELGDGKWSRGVCVDNKEKPARPKPSTASSVAFISAGAICMGLGVAGGLLVARATGFVPAGATVGAVLGVVGLVLLIIGLARLGNSR